MHTDEHIEKMRQAVMRLHELLEIMRHEVGKGDAAYQALFAHLTPDELLLPYKQQQHVIAEMMLDTSRQPLADIAIGMRLHSRDFEREFEALYNNIISDD